MELVNENDNLRTYRIEEVNGMHTNYIYQKINGYPNWVLIRIEAYDNDVLDYVILGYPRKFNAKTVGADYQKIVISKDEEKKIIDLNYVNRIIKNVIISHGIEFYYKDAGFFSNTGEKYIGPLNDDSYLIEFFDSIRTFSFSVESAESLTEKKGNTLKRIISLFK